MPLFLILLLIVLSACANSDDISDVNVCLASQSSRNQAFEQVAAGSVKSLLPVLASFACLDGGELEDAHVAVGVGLFRNPSQFAKFMRSQPLESHNVVAISRMLPGQFADHSCDAAEELIRRQQLVQQTANLGQWRGSMLHAINAAHEVEATRCELERAPTIDPELASGG